ncbi:hypothetical protein IAD21_03855 [Abditibacteriota bacterium]|nr:hypothetical protein IAD21_03855 [Abditibacteriota bacterium]
MRKPVLLIFANAAILIVLFCLMTQSLFIVARLASVKSTTGSVEIKRAGEDAFHAVAVGDVVKAGDELQTGDNGRGEFAWADGTRWKLEPKTHLKIERAAINSWRKSEQTQFRLDAGKVFVRVVKSLAPGSSFQIETPSAVAAVRGTVWSIEVANGQTRVGVYKGFVDVNTDGKGTQTVRPGHEAVAGDNGVKLENTSDDAAFEAQTDLIHPTLDVDVKTNKAAAIITGQTEAGDSLTLDGKDVRVLGNGAFLRRIEMQPGHNEWTFVATDKHGETTSACRAVEFDAGKGETTPSTCR